LSIWFVWWSAYPPPRFALGAVFVYQLVLLRRHEWNLDSNRGLKAFLEAA